ncbi:hypothetical protein V1478_008086 [Vespula squamosa]|uniref:Uncharacterized protein n=1 Tax=Vespula squamosa TaxID=30214 RepID=A0ABD2AXS0_VESSQ
MAEERANFSWRFPARTRPFNLTSPCPKQCGEENDSKVKTEESPVIVDSQARYPEISESSSWDIRKDS